jgi:polysaccharide biosynthesis protein
MFAMIFNLAGNIIFIPKFPEIGPIIAAWTTLLAFLFRAIMEMMIIRKKYKISFNYKKLFLYFIIIVNPVIFYLSNDQISIVKFGLKIVYLVIVTKLLVNKEVLTKLLNLVNGIKGKIMKQ